MNTIAKPLENNAEKAKDINMETRSTIWFFGQKSEALQSFAFSNNGRTEGEPTRNVLASCKALFAPPLPLPSCSGGHHG